MRLKYVVGLSLFLSILPGLRATDGVWTNIVGGNWSDAGKWKDGAVADGADATALIVAPLTVNTHAVTVDVSRTIGTLAFSDSAAQNNAWTLSDGGTHARVLTLSAPATVPRILVSNAIAYVDVTLGGTEGFEAEVEAGKSLYLRRTNSFSGPIVLRRGELYPASAGALGTGGDTLYLGDASTTLSDNLALRALNGIPVDRNIIVADAGNLVTLGGDGTGSTIRRYTGTIRLDRSVLLGNGLNAHSQFDGVISGAGGIKIGGPSANQTFTITLAGTNTFTGDAVHSKGSLYVNAPVLSGQDGALGNSTNAVILGDSETGANNIQLYLKPGLTFSRNIHVTDQGNGLVYLGVSGVGTGLFTGRIQVDRRLVLSTGSTSYRLVIPGTIFGTGEVALGGTGELYPTGSNTFSGAFLHTIGNGKLVIGQDVYDNVPGPLGSSTNPLRFTSADGNWHYLNFTSSCTFAKSIVVEPRVKAYITTSVNSYFPTLAGNVTYEGDLTLHAMDLSEIIVSGRLTTWTNILTIAGNSSNGDYIRLLNPSNSLAGSIYVGQAARLVVGANGAVNGATNIVLNPASGLNPCALFLDGGVTLDIPVIMPVQPYTAGAKVEIGTRDEGECVFGGAVSLFRTNTAPLFEFTAASNSLVRFTNSVTGSFYMRKTGLGHVSFEGTSGWTNDSELGAGTVWAVDGQGLPAVSRVAFSGGVLESTGRFSRAIGLAQGQVAWRTATAHGGFSARGGNLTVDLNNDGPVPLTWGSYGFVSNNTQLRFGSPLADGVTTFVDPLVINSGVTLHCYDNPATRADKAVLSGELSGSSGFAKSGPGTLVLSATNSLASNLSVNTDGGTLLVNGELPSNVSTLTVYSNGWLGGSGIIRTRTLSLREGSGFDWADEPGTLTITNSFAMATNCVFRFVWGPGGTSKVVCGNRLTLPAYAVVEPVSLQGWPPNSAVILTSADTVGSPAGWTIRNNSVYNFELVKEGNDILLVRRPKGTLMMLR